MKRFLMSAALVCACVAGALEGPSVYKMTEAQLLDNLKHMTDRTVLIVTHRPRVRDACDRVWEIE